MITRYHMVSIIINAAQIFLHLIARERSDLRKSFIVSACSQAEQIHFIRVVFCSFDTAFQSLLD